MAASALGPLLQSSKKHHNRPAATGLDKLPRSFATLYGHLFAGKPAAPLDEEGDQRLLDGLRRQYEGELRFCAAAMANGGRTP